MKLPDKYWNFQISIETLKRWLGIKNDVDNPVFGYIIKFKRKTNNSNKFPIPDYLSYTSEVQCTSIANNINKSSISNSSRDTDDLNQPEKQTEDSIGSSWLETQIMNIEKTKFRINNLKWGLFYLIKIWGFNSMGRGQIRMFYKEGLKSFKIIFS